MKYNSDYKINQILLNENWFKKIASVGGLATALATSDPVSANEPPKPIAITKFVNNSKSMHDYIGEWEGIRTNVYKDHTGKPTIGIGHYLNNSEFDRHLIKSIFGSSIDYDSLLSAKQSLTKDQVKKLFDVDVKLKEKTATKLIPDYHTFNQGTKNAIINALYRGDIGPKTIKLINDKKWKEAAEEYLNHTNAKTGPSQIKRRMSSNADLLKKNAAGNLNA